MGSGAHFLLYSQWNSRLLVRVIFSYQMQAISYPVITSGSMDFVDSCSPPVYLFGPTLTNRNQIKPIAETYFSFCCFWLKTYLRAQKITTQSNLSGYELGFLIIYLNILMTINVCFLTNCLGSISLFCSISPVIYEKVVLAFQIRS